MWGCCQGGVRVRARCVGQHYTQQDQVLLHGASIVCYDLTTATCLLHVEFV